MEFTRRYLMDDGVHWSIFNGKLFYLSYFHLPPLLVVSFINSAFGPLAIRGAFLLVSHVPSYRRR